MSVLPGYINGKVSTLFSHQIRKHLNLKTPALVQFFNIKMFKCFMMINKFGCNG